MGRSEVKRLAIEFDRANGTFRPGEFVSGRIFIQFSQPKEVRGLKLAILGESGVQWSAEKDKPVDKSDPYNECQLTNKPAFTLMTGREEYFSSKFYLFGNESGPTFTLPAGRIAYPFKYQLPSNLPCSFQHEHGYVRYTVEATLADKSSTFGDEVMTSFNVISTYDLNRNPEAFFPIREEVTKSFISTCICSAGKINAIFSAPSVGFVPGQEIPVTVHCENESTIDVAKIKVSLRKKLKFYAKSPEWKTKLEETIVAETKRVSPFTYNSEERITIQLKVPPLPPTGLEHCGLIDVDYVLRVVMCFTGMHFSIKRHFPILIGTVPLHNSANTYLPSAVSPYSTLWDPRNSPPPSYSASVYGAITTADRNKSVNGHGVENTFTQRYPIYD